MLHEIFEGIAEFFRVLLTMMGLGSLMDNSALETKLRVFIKQAGRTISVDLDPSWNVRKIKSVVAPKLDLSPDELKIIFAGRELLDDVQISSCDVGQRSCLYAVKVQIARATTSKIHEASITTESVVTKKTETNLADITENFDSTHIGEEDTSSMDVFAHVTQANKQSNFFVYCNTCENIQEGKLRVRCNTCLSGAFLVLRDPESWEDVLTSKQVPGSCETPGCWGSYAQFYFKCSNHITTGEEDTVPPLPLIKRNSELVPCLACGDSKDPVFVFECPNQHVTCIDCFRQYIHIKLNERQFIQDETVGYTLGCPALCKNSLVKDSHHFKLLGKYDYDRYQRFGTEEYVLKLGGVLCPQPDCGMGILPLDTGCNKIACVHGCGYVFCRRCLEGWHLGDCRQEGNSSATQMSVASTSNNGYSVEANRVAQAQWDDESRRAVRLTTKPCPNCRVSTERAAGCHHMACPKCQFEWCWLCQVKWDRTCQGNHWF